MNRFVFSFGALLLAMTVFWLGEIDRPVDELLSSLLADRSMDGGKNDSFVMPTMTTLPAGTSARLSAGENTAINLNLAKDVDMAATDPQSGEDGQSLFEEDQQIVLNEQTMNFLYQVTNGRMGFPLSIDEKAKSAVNDNNKKLDLVLSTLPQQVRDKILQKTGQYVAGTEVTPAYSSSGTISRVDIDALPEGIKSRFMEQSVSYRDDPVSGNSNHFVSNEALPSSVLQKMGYPNEVPREIKIGPQQDSMSARVWERLSKLTLD